MAEPPRPQPDRPLFERPTPRPRPALPVPMDLPAGAHIRTASTAGIVSLDYVHYKFDVNLAFEQVLVISTGNQTGDPVIITDLNGEVLAEHTRPAPGVTYVGNGKPRGSHPKPDELSPMS